MCNPIKKIKYLSFTILIFFFCQPILALDSKTTGFVSLVAGKTLSGTKDPYLDYECPCFIGDWANAGVYEKNEWSFNPDSTYGLQNVATINDDLHLTTQIVGNGADQYTPDLSWFYISYDFNEQWSLDFGRKRLPLFYYSDFYDISYAYYWIRVPGDVYGWAVTNYNGIRVNYSGDLGAGTLLFEAWIGQEKSKENRGSEKIYYGAPIDIEWTEMIGASFEYIIDWLSVRVVHMSNKDTEVVHYPSYVDENGDNQLAYSDAFATKNDQKFYGISMNVDYHSLLIRTEYDQFKNPSTGFISDGYLVSIAYKIGKFTPAFTFSEYADTSRNLDTGLYTDHERDTTQSVSVRWDVANATALKFQYDEIVDDSNWVFIGDAKAVAVGVDYVF